MRRAFGIDVGGSHLKAGVVDLAQGRLVGERMRVRTPRPATPEAVSEGIASLVADAGWEGPVGIAMPGLVRHGVVRAIANFDPGFVGVDLSALFGERLARPVAVLNDADAAGLAETRAGAARDVAGLVVVLTVGTGIGSALVVDGRVLPGSELGHLEQDGKLAEDRASDRVRRERDLSWKAYARRLARFVAHVDFVLAPELVVLGGGASRRAEKLLPLPGVTVPVRAAALGNDAGIVGAALAAAPRATSSRRR